MKTNTQNLFFWAVFLAIVLLVLSCKSNKKPSCSQFKTGNFLYTFTVAGKTYSFSINRNDSIQTEINMETGDTSRLAIKWTDPCTYELNFLESDFLLPDSLQKIREKMTIKTKITETASQYYLFKTDSDKSNLALNDTIWVKK